MKSMGQQAWQWTDLCRASFSTPVVQVSFEQLYVQSDAEGLSIRSAYGPFKPEEMFCQTDEAFGKSSQSTVTVHVLSKSSSLDKSPSRQKRFSTHPNILFVENFLETHACEQEEILTRERRTCETRISTLKAQRHRLEKDVMRLQKRLQQEVELHYALESAFGQAAGIFSSSPHLPLDAQSLLTDVAMLELAVVNLEERMTALNMQLCYEQRERQKAENRLLTFSAHDQQERQKVESRMPMLSIQEHDKEVQITDLSSSYVDQPVEFSTMPPSVSEVGCNMSSTAFYSAEQPCHASSVIYQQTSSPQCCHFGTQRSSSDGSCTSNPTSTSKQAIAYHCYANAENGLRCSCLAPNANRVPKTIQKDGSLFSPDKVKARNLALANSSEETKGRSRNEDIRNSWQHPNVLSEEMVKCMISIYQHLADPVDSLSSAKRIPSPTSPYGNIMSSSISSVSESSFLSLTRSPPVDLQSKELGDELCFDPYKTPEKLPWADIGSYCTAIEVSEMCVGKEQLEYAAEALRKFRSLVEQLSRVDPSTMKHEEKLAFWINVYNALMMHAYLAYGVPKNDFKFFSLMQKAAYTVGGHSFNAVVIEHLLLKGKAQWYRPQIALMLSHQKLKLREEVSTFAIDRVEPLVTFSLSFGATSSPAVHVYTAGNVQDELQAAFQDYVRASVGISVKGKLLVPKLLYDFGRDMMEESEIPEWICQLLPCKQSNLIRNCLKHRQHRFLNSKQFAVIPFDFRFRYLFLLGQSHSVSNKSP